MEAADRIYAGYKPLFEGAENASDVGTTQSIPQFMPDDIVSLCGLVKDILTPLPMLLRITGSYIVVGDLHGNFVDLIRIFRMFGMPPQTRYIFLGDYVDRGEYSVEVITLLFALFVKFPDDVVLLRGNHEVNEICSSYGFKASIAEQFGNVGMFHIFVDAFNYLSLAAVLNESVFLVHGGISQHLMHLEQIDAYKKPLLSDDEPLLKDLLWSDPSTAFPMFAESSRGEMNTYGKMALTQFLDRNKLKMMIRAHQYHNKGVHTEIGIVHTVFSASSYKAGDSNPSGVLIHEYGGVLKKRLYEAWDRPERNSLQFFNVRMKKTVLRSESMRGTMVQTFQKILTQSLRERKRTIGYNCGINTGCSRFIRPSQSGSLDDKRLTQTFCCGHESLP